MAPPERFTESQIEAALQRLAAEEKLLDGQPYAKSELVQKFSEILGDDAESFFDKFRFLAQASGKIGAIEIAVEGTRKWRTYTFRELSALVEKRNPTAPQVEAPVDNSSSSQPRSNDHPEDRVHLHAHIGMLLARRCVGISLPKASGSRSRGNTLHENPDFIGVRAEREPYSAMLPDWLDVGLAPARHVLIGAEIKPNIGSSAELSKAVRQALHNSRYFNERWLLSPMAQSLHAEAAMLGEEYNVGVMALTVSPSTRHHVLWNPRPSASRTTIRDFVSRYGPDELGAFSEKLEICRRVAEKLSDTLRSDLLEQLLSDQRDGSLIRRLPPAITQALAGDATDPFDKLDILSLAAALRSALMAAYEYDAPEEQEVAEFVADHLGTFLRSTGVPVSKAARQIVLDDMKESLVAAAHEAKQFADALQTLPSPSR